MYKLVNRLRGSGSYVPGYSLLYEIPRSGPCCANLLIVSSARSTYAFAMVTLKQSSIEDALWILHSERLAVAGSRIELGYKRVNSDALAGVQTASKLKVGSGIVPKPRLGCAPKGSDQRRQLVPDQIRHPHSVEGS